jgi:hypothetical protein
VGEIKDFTGRRAGPAVAVQVADDGIEPRGISFSMEFPCPHSLVLSVAGVGERFGLKKASSGQHFALDYFRTCSASLFGKSN